MAWYTIAAIYFTVWWICVFVVLPLGIQSEDTPVPGHSPGAPKPVNWRHKLLLTSIIALFLTWGAVEGFRYMQTEFRRQAQEEFQKNR